VMDSLGDSLGDSLPPDYGAGAAMRQDGV
jgi:hypothetical protein